MTRSPSSPAPSLLLSERTIPMANEALVGCRATGVSVDATGAGYTRALAKNQGATAAGR